MPTKITKRAILSQCMAVKELYGIELTGHEILILYSYNNSFIRKGDKTKLLYEPLNKFMLDLFGLGRYELGREVFIKDNIGEIRGPDFIGKEYFKEYCRRNVDLWREERNLL